jgi:hypothetical protein
MELEGEAVNEGPWVDQVVGLAGVRCDLAMMRAPNGHGRIELAKSTHRRRSGPSRKTRRRTRWASGWPSSSAERGLCSVTDAYRAMQHSSR